MPKAVELASEDDATTLRLDLWSCRREGPVNLKLRGDTLSEQGWDAMKPVFAILGVGNAGAVPKPMEQLWSKNVG